MNTVKIYIKDEKVYFKVEEKFYFCNKKSFSNLNIKQVSCNEIKKLIEGFDPLENTTIDENHLILTIQCTNKDDLTSCNLILTFDILINKPTITINESFSNNEEKQINLYKLIFQIPNKINNDSNLLLDLISFLIVALFGEDESEPQQDIPNNEVFSLIDKYLEGKNKKTNPSSKLNL